MGSLWITITEADETAHQRAVDALQDAGFQVYRSWIDERTPADIRTQQAEAHNARRDPAGAALGAGVTALFSGLTAWTFTLGGWWIAAGIACALITVVGLVGLVEGLHRKPRPPR
jgi:hypothetical protein